MKRQIIFYCLLFLAQSVCAQLNYQEEQTEKLNLGSNMNYHVEFQSSFAHGHTPLWMHSNRHGLGSLESVNGYLRSSIIRPLRTDSLRRWGIGYGVDVAIPYHFTSKTIVQQAFAEVRWLHGSLSVGSKEYPMELKNNALSSGSQTFGINARPVPQVRLALPDYWRLPFGNRWLHIKGHIAYGRMTDDNWQHDFTQRQSKYVDQVLYHSKAGFLKIGNEDRFCPWSLELGLEMATLFGGTSYQPRSNGETQVVKGNTNMRAFWNAFMPGGHDAPEEGIVYQNVEGNQLGSWLFRMNYEGDSWCVRLYGEKYFEDHSSMLQLDYDGYGTGEEWNVKKKRKFFLYDFKDMMLGLELNLKYNHWLQSLVFEYLYTKYQSGPVYHDHTQNMSHHISGRDNFYNHYIYPGWQHWGEVIGNPLYRSPLYNEDGTIEIQNNRFKAFHLGLSGEPAERLNYRFLATYQEGFGTYNTPFFKKHHNVSLFLETAYRWRYGWHFMASFGADFGGILGNNQGFQLTVSKHGIFNL